MKANGAVLEKILEVPTTPLQLLLNRTPLAI
jgi:hypothetical protein